MSNMVSICQRFGLTAVENVHTFCVKKFFTMHERLHVPHTFIHIETDACMHMTSVWQHITHAIVSIQTREASLSVRAFEAHQYKHVSAIGNVETCSCNVCIGNTSVLLVYHTVWHTCNLLRPSKTAGLSYLHIC